MGAVVSAPTRFQKLRGDGQPVRTQDNVGAVLDPLAEAVGNTPIMGAPPPPPIRPDLLNGFEDLGDPYALTSYHRDALGYVHLTLHVQNSAGTTTVTVFDLDQGYRPGATLVFAGTDGGGGVFEFSINAAGEVENITTFGAADIAALSCVFLAEN